MTPPPTDHREVSADLLESIAFSLPATASKIQLPPNGEAGWATLDSKIGKFCAWVRGVAS